MKYYIFLVIGLFSAIHSFAQSFTPVDSLSEVSFKIKNLGFNTTGHFSGLTGAITWVPDNLSGSHFDVQVQANTVNTGVDMRDGHLRGEDYFDAKNYPQIRFVSVKVTPSNKSGTLFVFGKLTMKGITKDLSFPFTPAIYPSWRAHSVVSSLLVTILQDMSSC